MSQPPPTAPFNPPLPPLHSLQIKDTTMPDAPLPPHSYPCPLPIPLPPNLTQPLVLSSPHLHRLQRDLLILTSFAENTTLHWRPSWFPQGAHTGKFWTLYNPPNVVTEMLPRKRVGRDRLSGRVVYTRRMRRVGKGDGMYVRSWEDWERVCAVGGVPVGWLSREMVGLMRLGLPRDGEGELIEPPTYPLYPEPQPVGKGRYVLDEAIYKSHLPPKFHNVRTHAKEVEDQQVVAVHSNGALLIEPRYEYFLHEGQWTHYSGTGGYLDNSRYVPDPDRGMKEQGPGRRWCWIPWTDEMEESCCRLLVKLKVDTRRARGGRGL